MRQRIFDLLRLKTARGATKSESFDFGTSWREFAPWVLGRQCDTGVIIDCFDLKGEAITGGTIVSHCEGPKGGGQHGRSASDGFGTLGLGITLQC